MILQRDLPLFFPYRTMAGALEGVAYQIGWDPNNRPFFTPQGCFVIPAGLPMGDNERTGRWLFDLETGLNLERTHRLVLYAYRAGGHRMHEERVCENLFDRLALFPVADARRSCSAERSPDTLVLYDRSSAAGRDFRASIVWTDYRLLELKVVVCVMDLDLAARYDCRDQPRDTCVCYLDHVQYDYPFTEYMLTVEKLRT